MVLAVKNEARSKMTRQEAGRKGGEKVAEERGSEFYKAIGRKGGESRGNRLRKKTRNKSLPGGRKGRVTLASSFSFSNTKKIGKP